LSAGHARLSASAAQRWLHCPGSLGDGGVSEYAATGTFAHSIAAVCLTENRKPAEWLGNTAIVDGFTVKCDQEMVDGITVYLDAIADDLQSGDITWTEMPLLTALQRVDPDMGGTADHVRYRPSTRHLRVTDLKYGAGTYVEVDDNEQAKIYGLGAMLETNMLVHEVELVIVQPRYERAEAVRSWTFKAVEILEFIADIKKAADLTRDPFAQRVTGPQCEHFCPNARTCPELEKKEHALVAMDFSAVTVYDPVKLATALEAIPLVKQRIKAIEEFAYAEATKGAVIPGWKLVDKRATRKWKSADEVKQWAAMLGIDPFEPAELMSPAQLEKKLAETAPKGKKKEAGKVLEPLVEKISSGTALVPESDDRAPAKTISVDDFAVIAS
jgi:hypothetical protein